MSDSVLDDSVGLETSAKTSWGATTPAPTMRPALFNSSRRVKSFDIEVNLTSEPCRHCLVCPNCRRCFPSDQFRHLSVPSPKSLEFRRRSVGWFSRRERSAAIWIITVERATRKNSQLAAARRVALKMGRLLRCSSVTYRSIRRAVACSWRGEIISDVLPARSASRCSSRQSASYCRAMRSAVPKSPIFLPVSKPW
jgi:hypothetical protein